MNQKKKIKYCLLFIVCCLLFLSLSVQGQNEALKITLTWSTDTYIPSNYPGKALPSKGSTIEVAVNIDSPGLNPQELDYRWLIDEFVQKEKSGLGQQTFKFPVKWTLSGDRYFIGVEIRNKQGKLLGSSRLAIKIVQPEIVLYPIKSLTNRTEREIFPLEASLFSIIKNYQIRADQEIEFTAQPYFFNIKDVNELKYDWSFSGQKASQDDPTKANILTLKIGGLKGSLSQNLNLRVENKRNSLERTDITAEIMLVP